MSGRNSVLIYTCGAIAMTIYTQTLSLTDSLSNGIISQAAHIQVQHMYTITARGWDRVIVYTRSTIDVNSYSYRLTRTDTHIFGVKWQWRDTERQSDYAVASRCRNCIIIDAGLCEGRCAEYQAATLADSLRNAIITEAANSQVQYMYAITAGRRDRVVINACCIIAV